MKKYSKENQKRLATWAADCALRALHFFEQAYPQDNRPRKAIRACRKWVRTGVFKMAQIRHASLTAHAAARKAKANPAACFAARAAGQAVATAHVPQHAFGAAYYALKAILAASGEQGAANTTRERRWQVQRAAPKLRDEVLKRLVIKERNEELVITVRKGEGF